MSKIAYRKEDGITVGPNGKPIGAPKTGRKGKDKLLYLSFETIERLETASTALGISQSELVNRLVLQQFGKKGDEA